MLLNGNKFVYQQKADSFHAGAEHTSVLAVSCSLLSVFKCSFLSEQRQQEGTQQLAFVEGSSVMSETLH